ncbi:MAG: GFA family protein [Pseudomonadota bacterium]
MNGSCLCGGVAFAVRCPPAGGTLCHCSQRRRQSGHVRASAVGPEDDPILGNDDTLHWCRGSNAAERGFRGVGGAFPFWRNDEENTLSLNLGAIDGPTDLRLQKHIFIAEKGDCYDIADGMPQRGN